MRPRHPAFIAVGALLVALFPLPEAFGQAGAGEATGSGGRSPAGETKPADLEATGVSELLRQINERVAALEYQNRALSYWNRDSINLNLGEGMGLEIVRVPAGWFPMGRTEEDIRRVHLESTQMVHENSGPQHKVEVTHHFFMSKFEIPQGLFDRYVTSKGGRAAASGDSGANLPAREVSWDEAKSFCDWLSRMVGCEVRLPTEIEWEYAARGRMGSRYAIVEGDPELVSEIRGVDDPALGESWCGVRGLSTNVSEWNLDLFDEEIYTKRVLNKSGFYEYDPNKVTNVVRGTNDSYTHRGGGIIDSSLAYYEGASRRRKLAETKKDWIGFRVVLLPRKRVK